MGDSVGAANGFNPNRGVSDYIKHPLDSFRDANIKTFFKQAGIDNSKLTDNMLFQDEIMNDKNADNPQAKMLSQYFKQYAKSKDMNGAQYMSPEDVSRFIDDTKGGTANVINVNKPSADSWKSSGLSEAMGENPYDSTTK